MQTFVNCIETDTNNFLARLTALMLLGQEIINTEDTVLTSLEGNAHTKLVVSNEKNTCSV